MKFFFFQFRLESISKNFTKGEMNGILLSNTVYDFSVDYSVIEKEDIMKIHVNLMIKSNIR